MSTQGWQDPRDVTTLTAEGRWYATQLLQLAMRTLVEADRLFQRPPGMPWEEQHERLRARQHAEAALFDAMVALRDPPAAPTPSAPAHTQEER